MQQVPKSHKQACLAYLKLLISSLKELYFFCVFLLLYLSLFLSSLLDLFTLGLQLVHLSLQISLLLFKFVNLKQGINVMVNVLKFLTQSEQIDGRRGAGSPKLTWKKLTERDCHEWKLTKVDPQEWSTWRSGVRSAMSAASQLPGKGPTDVDDAPAH